ncbi:carbamoyl-phosphate synthase large subunit [Magnetovibrio blakemorei]|uniref:Carbamoyl phosphate synthase large chain n=1 Tax=Magnetovibrio blakemorei TaxID=28181 RepID=A0A1E5Q6H3_9PROT|nr:carbamoyl-phosphate synthase large subunit [Magnetovibrio blakemorei]OEJ66565.1 carbamoyl phosphate synthase large subunit [Magnetovibrio blakemorei]
MPKRTDIKSILIVGAGPIVIGQACEFDYSGAQACKALREEGYRVILVNSNPATIMTDPNMADATYIEPITPEFLEMVIIKEKPDAILPTMGGQTALNAAMSLAENGALKRHNVELIGANEQSIAKAEDRQQFRDAMDKIGLSTPRSAVVKSLEEGRKEMEHIGLPIIIRPSFTMGGIGGGIAYNMQEFDEIVSGGLAASPTHEVLIEQSVLGWKEFEMEVVRDKADNCIIVCSIENIDPMGVHTGDSITVAPALTLTDKEYQIMRNASIAVLREIGVDTGGSNVQFAVNPADGQLIVIEMNPRVSRSSALASKATGFPIAKIAAKLAVGYTLDELKNDITGGITPASFEPTIDYVVTKIPRFTFEKFPGADALLTTAMKSVGEAMSIGRTFAESLQKGLRSMETGLTGLNEVEIEGVDPANPDVDKIVAALARPTPDRLLVIAQAFRHGLSVERIQRACKYEPWFLRQIQDIVTAEEALRKSGLPQNAVDLLRAKKMGFSDERLAEITGTNLGKVTTRRIALGVRPVYKRVDTCAGEFPSKTPYMYSCYEGDGINPPQCEADVTDRKKVIILGGGPNRIGQGIEFDYCCVHAAYAMKDIGLEAIMVNCNPETVSTDYDTSDRLYFEPLTAETVIELIRREQTAGEVLGVIVQFGGQTPLKLAHALEAANIPILGTSPDAIDLAEDRERFQTLLNDLNLKQPANGIARSIAEAEAVALKIGYPLVVRPSYVLGGRAMEIVHDHTNLMRYMTSAVKVSGDSPVLLDSYLQGAVEVDVDALADGTGDVYIAGIMEHIEEAGIHSGDSACSLPPYSLTKDIIEDIRTQTKALAIALKVVGLMNIQFAVQGTTVFLLEVNPRASRTVPFVAKATGIPIAKIAARVMAGETIASFDLGDTPQIKHVAVKEAVFPFARFPGVDIILGPEMKSTGEVMGLDDTFEKAFAKSQLGAGVKLPTAGTAFISVKESDKAEIVDIAQRLTDQGFAITATSGTADHLRNHGITVSTVNKVMEGRPHCVDSILSGEVQLVMNTTEGAVAIADSFSIRRSALTNNVPHYTTMAGASAAVDAIKALQTGTLEVKALQDYPYRAL